MALHTQSSPRRTEGRKAAIDDGILTGCRRHTRIWCDRLQGRRVLGSCREARDVPRRVARSARIAPGVAVLVAIAIVGVTMVGCGGEIVQPFAYSAAQRAA